MAIGAKESRGIGRKKSDGKLSGVSEPFGVNSHHRVDPTLTQKIYYNLISNSGRSDSLIPGQ